MTFEWICISKVSIVMDIFVCRVLGRDPCLATPNKRFSILSFSASFAHLANYCSVMSSSSSQDCNWPFSADPRNSSCDRGWMSFLDFGRRTFDLDVLWVCFPVQNANYFDQKSDDALY